MKNIPTIVRKMDVRIIMAEFCLACWNKLNKRNEPAERYVLSKDLDLCEGCGEWKNVIVRERKSVLWKSGVQAVQIFNRGCGGKDSLP